jgi:hypothetical protein
LLELAHAHGSLLYPPPRNGVEKVLPEFTNGSFPRGHYDCGCKNGTNEYCESAQSCLWFNQGCTIYCPCTGNGTASRVPNNNMCGTTKLPTNNDPLTRTLNRQAVAGSSEDVYKFMPWRAPGTAILGDPCGIAGGSPIKQNNGGEYIATDFAKQGDLGSKVLKPLPSGVIWHAGSEVETTLFIKANHAGGWQFRLCKDTEDLTEECFQRTPIPFAGTTQKLLFPSGKEETINATLVTTGTYPAGSAWIMNPVPECCPPNGSCESAGFTCGSSNNKHCYDHQCSATSVPEFPWPTADAAAPPTNLEPRFGIVDILKLPSSLEAGDYVLGWRWDAEETAQVWTACADVTITV